jgi:hypothetical protein
MGALGERDGRAGITARMSVDRRAVKEPGRHFGDIVSDPVEAVGGRGSEDMLEQVLPSRPHLRVVPRPFLW